METEEKYYYYKDKIYDSVWKSTNPPEIELEGDSRFEELTEQEYLEWVENL